MARAGSRGGKKVKFEAARGTSTYAFPVPSSPAPESQSDESAGQGKHPPHQPLHPLPGTTGNSQLLVKRAGFSRLLALSATGRSRGLEREGDLGRLGRLAKKLAWGGREKCGDSGHALVSYKAAKPQPGYHLPILFVLAHAMCE